MTQTIVALYDTVQAAERAVRDLRGAGVPDRDISLVAADAQGEYARGLKPDDSSATEKGIGLGAALGGLGGLLVGLGALTIPGIGPVVAAGPLATAISALVGAGAGALAGGAAGGLLGALVDAGLPKEQAEFYAEGVRRGGTLLAVSVPNERVDQARAILERHDPVDVEERAANWRQQGWTGYDPNAGPYTGERMAAGAAGMGAHSMREEPMGAQRMSTQSSQSMEAGAGQGSAAVYSQGQEAGSSERARQQPDRVAASDYERYAPAFRGHYQTNLAQSGFQYEHFEPAYQYGLTLGNYEPYRGLDWMQIEGEARHAWEERNPNTWDRIRDAVRYGWERVKMPVR
jgi:hypothetical protein